MRILPPFEEKIRHTIRDEIAKKPTVTMVALKEELEKKFGRDFHHSYIRKLVGKVRNEITYEIDSAKIEKRLAFTRENYRVMREKLLEILNWKAESDMPRPIARDRVEAAKAVVMMDLAVLNAEMAAGLYKKPNRRAGAPRLQRTGHAPHQGQTGSAPCRGTVHQERHREISSHRLRAASQSAIRVWRGET
jgi:hypothetical protein